MTHHHLVYRHDRDTTTVKPTCDAPRLADCRLACRDGCESWTIDRDEIGPYHMVDHFDGQVRHELTDNGLCNWVEWLEQEPGMIPELDAVGEAFVIGTVDVEPEWDGDNYLWRRATPGTHVTSTGEAL